MAFLIATVSSDEQRLIEDHRLIKDYSLLCGLMAATIVYSRFIEPDPVLALTLLGLNVEDHRLVACYIVRTEGVALVDIIKQHSLVVVFQLRFQSM